MARAVGIDIGSKSLKIIQVELAANKPKITHFFDLELPFGSDYQEKPDLLVEPIHSIFKDYGLEKNNIVLSLPTQDCILREINVDFVQEEHINKIIKYEAEKYLHSYPIEDVIIDYQKLHADERKSRLFVAAVPKVILAKRLKILDNCDLDPISVDLDVAAIANVVSLCHQAKGKTNLIIDVGASATKLIIMHDGKVFHVRATRLEVDIQENEDTPKENSRRIPQAEDSDDTWQDMDVDWDLENELIVTLPIPDGMEVDRMVLVKKSDDENPSVEEQKEEIFKKLVKEIKRTLLTLKIPSPIELVCLTGGGSQIQGLKESLRDSLKVETITLDYSSSVEVVKDIEEDHWRTGSIAMGCALKGLNKVPSGMEFRKEEFSYTKRFEMIKFPLAVVVTLFFLIMLILAYGVQEARIKQQRRYKRLENLAITVYQRALEREAPKSGSNNYISNLKRKMEAATEETSPVPPVRDTFEQMRAILSSFNTVRRIHYIRITEITVNQESIEIKGNHKNVAAIDLLKKNLGKMVKEDKDGQEVPLFDMNKVGIEEGRADPVVDGLSREYSITCPFTE